MKHNRADYKSKSNIDKKQREKRKRLTSRIILGVSISLALIYIVFVFVTTNFMGNDSIVTQTVYNTSAADVISSEGFVIRKENYINNVENGVLVYHVTDGDKVKVNGKIASVYSSEADATNSLRIKELEKSISSIEGLNKTTNSASIGLDSVNNQINLKMISFIKNVNQRNFDDIKADEDDLMTSIYRKQIVTGDLTNFNETLDQMLAEKTALEQSTDKSIGTVTTDKSGYFVSSVDGYENSFDLDNLSQISYTALNDIKPDDVSNGKYAGKVIEGVSWYIACPVTNDEATAILHNDSMISIRLPYATTESIPASVISVNQFKDEEKAVVILECSNMNSALSKVRKETVHIELNLYKGLKIPKIALHDDYVSKTVTADDGTKSIEKSKVQGVFVKYGSELIFKQVHILYSGDDYVICNENPDYELLFNGTTVSLYDEVVIEGENLYDGKLIK